MIIYHLNQRDCYHDMVRDRNLAVKLIYEFILHELSTFKGVTGFLDVSPSGGSGQVRHAKSIDEHNRCVSTSHVKIILLLCYLK